MSSNVLGVSFDAHDANAIATFWAEVLQCAVADGANADNASLQTEPDTNRPRMSFHRVPEDKSVKNRMHLDLITTDFDTELTRLISLGAIKLSEVDLGIRWATLADPEGNEFDVIDG
ncbi:MAG: glyoxalase/bleomycin resistance/dioxygenase family protein [Gordonia sp.]|nr:glyoxalase/bleomycin resistance/dioxygenase family protein [Gordonia sp. (in: high G+C Gram-positive bacteria)]